MTMTMQEVFNTVRDHLLMQGHKALDSTGTRCMYRAPDGTKCAAGVLILDEYYDDFEGNGVEIGEVRDALHKSGVDPSCFELVCDLQAVHDQYDVEDWACRLARVASVYGLQP